MFKFSKRNAIAPADSGDSVMHSAANSSQGATDVQRELIRVAFKDTVRSTGVPVQWLDCKVRTRPGPAGTEQIEVRLIMKKWSGHLLRYAMAFQKQFKECLDRYEPAVDHGAYEWLWEFSKDCDCPFPVMPSPQEWEQKLEASKTRSEPPKIAVKKSLRPAVVTAPTPTADKQFGLRDIFADLQA